MRISALTVGPEYPDNAFKGRELVPFVAPPLPAVTQDNSIGKPDKTGQTPFDHLIAGVDIRDISPREISDLSMDLYAAGVLSWREYDMLAFQPETQPAYDSTTGALTGEKADPDRPRDFIAVWEDRLDFERRYNADDRELIERTEHIVGVLRRIDSPTNLII
ncbi:MAG: hypothetical protein A3G18_11545 [Rhodospirillales bacterium RIFCSPLOWO2_12_FULL_58_28]|nr:MAG: hypothetical protein A3H92_10695 [Rhodospirillales bacterium RIFCSPLOWO2_02_FULL_58_16]OHC77814.1 MAG: hypothetical protein A3G18_11545 [Rhodospirillales bacterium RIFCSPLOWO2_12_FULL_58_28]